VSANRRNRDDGGLAEGEQIIPKGRGGSESFTLSSHAFWEFRSTGYAAVIQLVKKFLVMEPDSSPPLSQRPVICPYTESVISNKKERNVYSCMYNLPSLVFTLKAAGLRYVIKCRSI
jgi:hypothetical protein